LIGDARTNHTGVHHDERAEDAKRTVPRYVKRHLFCREENSCNAAQDGEGGAIPDLKKAFEKHRDETEGHVARLEKVFGLIDKKPQAKTCDAIVGITEEGAEIMTEYKGSPALDAGLLAAAQAVEHYEMSRYGTLRTWAAELGLNDAVRLFEQTLEEEKKTDATLTKIAETVVNQQAEAA
jgi:ferritin-like metal-binding protein YciE